MDLARNERAQWEWKRSGRTSGGRHVPSWMLVMGVPKLSVGVAVLQIKQF